MSKRTPTEDKAIQWWCENNNLIPQISAHPVYYFIHRETKEPSQRNIKNLTVEYKNRNKADKDNR